MDIDLNYLDPDSFEDLCNDLLMQEISDITTIDGSGGDDGIDCFKGSINGEMAIFQHKFHTGRIEYSQKRQIRDSFDRAQEEHPELEKWILLIATEFTPKEQQWFYENIVSSTDGIAVKLWNKPKIENRLIQYDFLVERYFNKSLYAVAKKIDKAFDFMSGGPVDRVMGAGKALQGLRQEYAHLGIDYNYNSEKKEYEVRFNPQFDIEISMGADLEDEILERLQAGEEVELTKDEVEMLDISPGIFDLKNRDFDTFVIRPTYKSIKKPVQFEIPSSNFRKELTLSVESISESGIELRTNDEIFDFSFVVLSDSDESQFNFKPKFIDQPVHRISEYFEFMNELIEKEDFIIRGSETANIIIRAQSQMRSIPEELELLEIFIENLYQIEVKTGESFTMTDDWNKDDFSNSRIVRDILADGEARISWSSFELDIQSPNAQQLLNVYDEQGALVDADLNITEYSLPILGEEITINNAILELPSAQLENRDEIEEQLAKDGIAEFQFTPEDGEVIIKGDVC